jgi:hypothetical protein
LAKKGKGAQISEVFLLDVALPLFSALLCTRI